MNEKKLIKIIAFAPAIFIPIIVILLALIIAKANNDHFNANIQKLEANFITIEQEAAKSTVDNFVSHIVFKKSMIKDELLARVKNRVDNAYDIAIAMHTKYKNIKSDAEIKEMIVTALRTLTWNGGESFIWILDYDGIFHLAPEYLRHLEGSSIIDFQDATGKYVIKEEIALCKEEGEGYLWDTFTKPNSKSDKQYKQVVFVKALGHYNLYLGSGEYLDTAKKVSDTILLQSLNHIDALNKNYIFIIKENADIVLHGEDPSLVSKNLLKLGDNTFKSVYENISKSLVNTNSAFTSYQWSNSKTNKIEKKISYVKKVPNSDWIVGSGYYMSDIKALASQQSSDLYDSYQIKLKNLIFMSILLIFILLMMSYVLARYIKKIFIGYRAQINAKNIELFGMNETLEERVVQRTQELQDATEKLEMLATTDSLTDINNRYSIMKMLDLEISRSRRYNEPLSVFMYDIDYFKRVNDTYGHHVGDETLYTLTKVVQGCLRDIDIVGRYGGEEFLVIMPSTSLPHAIEVGNRVCQEVANHRFQNIGQLTISIGLVELNSSETMDMLFSRADTLLYKSKNNGRNRVSF